MSIIVSFSLGGMSVLLDEVYIETNMRDDGWAMRNNEMIPPLTTYGVQIIC